MIYNKKIDIDCSKAIISIKELQNEIDNLIKKCNPKWYQFFKRVTINIYFDNDFKIK